MDAYDFKARFSPMALVLLPVALVFIYVFHEQETTLSLFAPLGSGVILSILLAELGRVAGKSIEPKLWKAWGGKPTTLMFSYSRSSLNREILKKYHMVMIKLHPDDVIIDEVYETNYLEQANLQYDKWTAYLRQFSRTHPKECFVVTKELTSYGMRRNIFGLKFFAVTTSLLSLLIISYFVFIDCLEYTGGLVSYVLHLGPVRISSILLLFGLLVFWLFIVNVNWVRQTAFSYAQQLLGCCDILYFSM